MTEFQKEFIKDPEAVLEYQFDWTNWLDSDSITSFTVSATDGIVIDSSTHSLTIVTVWLSGGTAGNDYYVTNHIITTAGREDDRTIKISVKDR